MTRAAEAAAAARAEAAGAAAATAEEVRRLDTDLASMRQQLQLVGSGLRSRDAEIGRLLRQLDQTKAAEYDAASKHLQVGLGLGLAQGQCMTVGAWCLDGGGTAAATPRVYTSIPPCRLPHPLARLEEVSLLTATCTTLINRHRFLTQTTHTGRGRR